MHIQAALKSDVKGRALSMKRLSLTVAFSSVSSGFEPSTAVPLRSEDLLATARTQNVDSLAKVLFCRLAQVSIPL